MYDYKGYRKKHQLARNAYSKNYREEHLAYFTNYRKAYKIKLNKYYKKYAKLHKEEICKRKVLYRQRNKLQLAIYKKQYMSKFEHKLKNRIYSTNRRAQIKGLTTILISQVYAANKKKFGVLTCYLCLKPIPKEKDTLEHKIPLSRGGTNNKRNLAVACNTCNCKKGTKTNIEYLKLRSLK
jgi:5-methylcytosine-specific restriction endonuclease McrA